MEAAPVDRSNVAESIVERGEAMKAAGAYSTIGLHTNLRCGREDTSGGFYS